MTSITKEIIDQPGVLADIAECLYPWTEDGKDFLSTIADKWLNERHRWECEDEAKVEIVDSAIPISTHRLWTVYADIGGYQEELADYGMNDATVEMEDRARFSLGLIGDRLIDGLIGRSQ